MGKLSGKVAIISGSSRGIGRSIAQRFLEEEAVVYITGRDPKPLNNTFNDFQKEYPHSVRSFCGDLTSTKKVKELVTAICGRDGHLDIAVANIGSGQSKPGWDIEDPIWLECMEKNFFTSVILSRECLKVMTPAKSGNIIFISSIAGCEVISAPIPYAAAKSALLSYMKYTAHLIGRDGIRMNAISPGNILFDGGSWSKKIKEDPEWVNAYIKENVPCHTFGTPDDIARLACFLASDQSSFITGANFIVDGGQTRRVL